MRRVLLTSLAVTSCAWAQSSPFAPQRPAPGYPNAQPGRMQPGVPASQTPQPSAPQPGSASTPAPGSPSFFGIPVPAREQAAPAEELNISDPRIADLIRAGGDNFIFVEGAEGKGSAFLCLLNGKRVLLSNQHVIRGNPNVRFTTLNQAVIKAGAARAAAGHDLISYDAPEAVAPLEAVLDFAQTVSVGDEVVVLGNTEGARVLKPLPGRVAGIGPNLVEITSAFLPGNSGSPIIHLKSGKVIGIATYAIVRAVNSLTQQREASVRRFGYRLDTVQAWQPINWQIYQAEAAAMKKVSDMSGLITAVFSDIDRRRLDPKRYTDTRLTTAFAPLVTLQERKNMNPIDRKALVKTFLGNMRGLVRKDVDALQNKLFYDFFQRELADELKMRNELYNELGEGMKQF